MHRYFTIDEGIDYDENKRPPRKTMTPPVLKPRTFWVPVLHATSSAVLTGYFILSKHLWVQKNHLIPWLISLFNKNLGLFCEILNFKWLYKNILLISRYVHLASSWFCFFLRIAIIVKRLQESFLISTLQKIVLSSYCIKKNHAI